MRSRRIISGAAMSAILAVGAIGSTAVPAFAADTFVVNRTGNAGDANAGDGKCDVAPGTSGNQCTLRAAIQEANSDPDQDVIAFKFSGTAVKKIQVPGALPQVTEPVVIDGFSVANTRQNSKIKGSNAKLRIQLKGPNKSTFDGLDVAAPSTVKGLVISGFRRGIIVEPGGEGSVFASNYIGVNPSGMGKARNLSAGIFVDCDSAVTIGGAGKAKRNIISGNKAHGIQLCERVAGTVIAGNIIGAGADNKKDLGNGGAGIRAFGTKDIAIGGDAKAARNTIAFNGSEGVDLAFSGSWPAGVRILANSIYRNGKAGIALHGSANHGQKPPIIKTVKNVNGKTKIGGQMLGSPGTTYQLRFFVDTHKEREGKVYLKKISVTTNASGKGFWSTTVSKKAKGTKITATATNTTASPDETSGFAYPKKVQ